MSYDSEVAADNPLVYWKCEELSGSTLLDSSGNGRDASILTSSVVYGIGGPIETDALSLGMSNWIARSSVDSALDTADHCTWEVWGYTGADTVSTRMLLSRGSLGEVGVTITGAEVADARFRTSGTLYTLTYPGLQNFTWYHIVFVRNGTSALLYVNGYLRDQETSIGTDPIQLDSTTWGIGVTGTGSTNPSHGVSHVAIYDTPLSAARVLAHYEAAKASLPLRATITINLSLDLNTDQLVPVDLPFGHNWSDTFGDGVNPITEELTFATNTNKSEPDYEQRIGARPHGPLRSLDYHISPASGAARARFQGLLYRPGDFYTIPVWSDFGLTTAQADSGASTIECDTTKRDYEPLSYCGVCTDPGDPTTYQFFQIASGGVADDALTLASTVGTTIPSGSYVFPARIASISDDTLAVKSYAADHEDSMIRFDVIESELSTRRITAYTPDTTYLTYEVFTLETAKVNFLDSRPYDLHRRIQSHGKDYQYAQDTGSPQSFPVSFLLKSRDELSAFYGWLDARCGSLVPLFVSTKEQDLIPLSRPTSTTLTVKKTGFTFHYGRRHLEILKTDGSFSRVRITAVSDNGDGTETWTASSAFPTFASISKVSFLKWCVLGSDTITLKHWKGIVTECSVSFRELLTSPE